MTYYPDRRTRIILSLYSMGARWQGADRDPMVKKLVHEGILEYDGGWIRLSAEGLKLAEKEKALEVLADG